MFVTTAFVLLTVLPGLAQTRTLRLDDAPWNGVMTTLQTRGDTAAVPQLEAIARDGAPGVNAWQRAHAWRWAGEIAKRHDDLEHARADFAHAIELDHDGNEGRMARVHVAEVSIAEHRWSDARANLVRVVDDPDPVIAFYARDRLRTVNDHATRTGLRWGSVAALVLALALTAWLAARAPRRAGAARAFGYALLVTESLAIAAAALVPRWNPLAQSGVMAGTLPTALFGAVVWATCVRARPWSVRVASVALWLVAVAAAVYLGLDLLWWSVERPIP